MTSMSRLFDAYAHRYDLHTPPDHYRHDYDAVISLATRLAERPTLFDLGCGTGAFLERAMKAGVDARGVDSSPGMIAVAQERLGRDRVELGLMQDFALPRRVAAIPASHGASITAKAKTISRRCLSVASTRSIAEVSLSRTSHTRKMQVERFSKTESQDRVRSPMTSRSFTDFLRSARSHRGSKQTTSIAVALLPSSSSSHTSSTSPMFTSSLALRREPGSTASSCGRAGEASPSPNR